MTQTASAPPTPLRLPVPQEQAVFAQLSTDFYPWTEVISEIESLQGLDLTAVLDVHQQGRWARFVWVRGQFQGGMAAGGSEVTLEAAMRGLPRAQVSLLRTEPLVAEVLWECRNTVPVPLDAAWPEAQTLLIRDQFQGALLSGSHCSFWESGRVMTGSLPPAGATCYALSSSTIIKREVLLRVWSEIIAGTYQTHRRFDEVWKQVCMHLSTRYPVLDPFAGEIRVSRGHLDVDEEVPMQEFRPAMLEAYRVSLRRMNLKTSDLPLQKLQQSPDWVAAGLENL